MIPSSRIFLDPREAFQIITDLLARRPGYITEWLPSEKGSDAAIMQIFVRYLRTILQRLNQVPEKNKLAFLDFLGIQLIPAQSARAPVIFQLSAQATDGRVPAGTRIAAPPPPERTGQIVFETERATGLASAKLKAVVSLWPGRDQYIDHSPVFLSGEPFQPFKKNQLQNTPHILYLAHDVLLALAGKSSVDVTFELTTACSERLDILWEYWDGKIWREFLAMRPSCDEEEANKLDSTAGLTRSGRFLLEADCAETSKTNVNGIEAFWIRGRLTEPLPPNPAQVLPEVESVRLSSTIAQALRVSWQDVKRDFPSGRLSIECVVVDTTGIPVPGVAVKLSGPNVPTGNNPQLTNGEGKALFQLMSGAPSNVYTIQVSFDGVIHVEEVPYDAEKSKLSLRFTLQVQGLSPDKAFADATSLDVSKPFYPFGLQPQPGSAFYFNQEEVFSKPGAKVRIYILRTSSPQDSVDVTTVQQEPIEGVIQQLKDTKPLKHIVAWEYWNGKNWFTLFQSLNSNKPSKDLNNTEIIDFTIPSEMVKTKVNDQEGLWMRARLVSGGFGFTQKVSWFDSQSQKTNEFTYVITQPPALADFRLGYTWQYGPFHPEHVLTYNDFQYEDHTEEAKWPGRIFQPFKPVSDITPALYLGFDKKLPVDRLSLYFDILERREETEGPALIWEYWDGISWQDFSVEDETRHLRIPGLLSFIASDDSQPLARFDTPLHWVRARLKEDGPPGEPTMNNIFPNAVWAVQQQTITDETIGLSTAQPNQVFTLRQIPVLAGEHIEVRELAGPRANVEWRILAMDIYGGDNKAIRELEEMLGKEGPQTDIEKGDLRLRRDRNKRVTEVWVRWQSKRHLFFSAPNDRHYVVERARGRIIFGDEERGKIPPLGASVLARKYRTGGGLAGNVAARTITQLLGGIAGIEAVFNPKPAEGGADAEALETLSARGPKTLRHRGRALLAEDYETMAKEASPAVAFARVIPSRDPSKRKVPGWVTLLIIPQSEEPRPWPSFGLREHVRKFIEAHASADLVGVNHIYVRGPEYLAIDNEAKIVPLDPAEAGVVEVRAREALEAFFHPLRGGPAGNGWELGRDVFLSDIASVLERVEGVDYVEELALFLNGVLQREKVRVAEDRIVVAGEIRIKIKQG